MNYRYKVSNEDIIVSEQEHQTIQDAVERGAKHLSLRGGNLGVNISMCGFWKETDQMTEAQKKENDERLKIELQKTGQRSDYIKRTKAEFYKQMGWDGE